MSCPHQIKECNCKCCGILQCCVWYRRNWWCELCWVICLLQLALDSDDDESPRPEKSSDILGSENEDKTRKRKRHTSLDSDDEDSQRTQEPSDTLGDKVTATKQKLRAFVSDSFGDEYERIWGCKQSWMWHRRKSDVIDLASYSMEALLQHHSRLTDNWKNRSERDKFLIGMIESCDKDIFSARYLIHALVQYHSELARIWTYRSEIDKNKDPMEPSDKDIFSARYSMNVIVQYHSALARLWTFRSEIDKNKDPMGRDYRISASETMKGIVYYHSKLERLWTYRSEIDKSKDPIEPGDEDIFSARYSMNAIVKYHSELARLWTNRSEIDKSKDPIDKDVDQNNKLASKSTIVLEDTCVLGSSTSAKGSAETWAGTFARTCGSIFRIFSKDEKQMSLDLVKPLQDQAVAWVPPPPPDPPNPS